MMAKDSDIIADIEAVVLSKHGVSVLDFTANMKCRKTVYVSCRYYIWVFSRVFTDVSYDKLAALYGKTHADIMHGVRVIIRYADNIIEYRAMFSDLAGLLAEVGYVLPDNWREVALRGNVNNF